MAGYHTVEQGEQLSDIAAHYGFWGYLSIWDHPKNAELRQRRPNPHVLFPGDSLFIPDKETKKELAETSCRNRFRLSRRRLLLRIVLKDSGERPMACMPCTLEIEGNIYRLTTSNEGLVEQEIPANARQGKLSIGDMEVPIRVGYMDPVEEVSGQQARLNNLGYDVGEVGTADEERMRLALEEFQFEQGLNVSGACDAQTRARLVEVHGC